MFIVYITTPEKDGFKGVKPPSLSLQYSIRRGFGFWDPSCHKNLGAAYTSASKVAATFHPGQPSPKILQSTIHHIHSFRAALGFVCILSPDTPMPGVSSVSGKFGSRTLNSSHQRIPLRTFPQHTVNHHSLTCRRHHEPKAVICFLIFSGFSFP